MKKLFTIPSITCLLVAGAFTASAQYDTLISFDGPNGDNPRGSFVIAGNKLMGMTQFGGGSNDGNVFSIRTNGSADHSFYTFSGANGNDPFGSLTYAGGHTVYGMTQNGGAHNVGCVFSMDTNGANYKDLWDFAAAPSTNGSNPTGSLILDGKKLFGMTYFGGLGSEGNIFSIDTNGGNYKDLYDFNNPSGANPEGSLILNASGTKLFGMTDGQGSNGKGTAFTIDTGGTNFKVLWNFGGAANNGALPVGALTLIGHQLYGMTVTGGINSQGNIFSIDSNGTNYKDRWDFDGGGDTNGTNPWGELLLSGRVLLGMTGGGGVNSGGNIFRIDTDGTRYHDIWDFTGATGSTPYGDVTLSNGVVYGMTEYGGKNGEGVVFADTLIYVSTTDTGVTTCNGANTGHATAHVHGGTTPFTYSWTGGSTQAKATGLSAGTYTVTVTDYNGIGATASVTITQPTAIASIHDSTADNGSSNGSAGVTASGGTSPYTYLWNPGGATTAIISGLSAGTYTCTVEDHNGCTYSTSVTVKSTAGINSIASNPGQITVYPNPNNGQFTMRLSVAGAQSSVEIYNMLGEKVYSQFSTTNSQLSIDLSSQPEGIYLYRVVSENGALTGQGKLIIQK